MESTSFTLYDLDFIINSSQPAGMNGIPLEQGFLGDGESPK